MVKFFRTRNSHCSLIYFSTLTVFQTPAGFGNLSPLESDSIVIALDVAEDFRPGICNRFKDAVLNQFRFETGKETLRLSALS